MKAAASVNRRLLRDAGRIERQRRSRARRAHSPASSVVRNRASGGRRAGMLSPPAPGPGGAPAGPA